MHTVSAITAFYSKQDPMELVWVAASLNMSERDKRVCASVSLYIFLRVCVCASIVCIQNNNSSPNMKGVAH